MCSTSKKLSARGISKAALEFVAVVAFGTVIVQVCSLAPCATTIVDLGRAIADFVGSKTHLIAVVLLLILVLVQFIVHRLDKSGVAKPWLIPSEPKPPGEGIVGRYYWLCASGCSAASGGTGAAGKGLVYGKAIKWRGLTLAKLAEAVAEGLAQAQGKNNQAELQKQVKASFHETDKSAIRAFMTKQSIFAALSTFLLGAVSRKLPAQFPSTLVDWIYVGSAGGFLLTLLIVLVSIQTYSIYVRIRWDESSGNQLLVKGRQFDEGSFYCLTISLLLGLCAYQPWAALVAIPVFGWLMRKYYFFKD